MQTDPYSVADHLLRSDHLRASRSYRWYHLVSLFADESILGTRYSSHAASPLLSILATGIVGVVNFVMTIPAVLYVDNFGRKPLLFFGATSMAISLAIVAALIAQKGPVFTDKSAGNAAVFFIYWFIASFAVTWGPLAWVVSAEVFVSPWRSLLNFPPSANQAVSVLLYSPSTCVPRACPSRVPPTGS